MESITEPSPPFPAQHQERPGLEAAMEPRPRYEAPLYRESGKLEGKRALITGGDSGIGRAVALLFAREGADVAICYLAEEAADAEETAAAIREVGRQCVLLVTDVTEPRQCARAVRDAVAALGGLDILVNNAAFQQHQDDILSISPEQWDRTFRTNIYGYFHMARAAVPHLARGSAIINTGSVTGIEGSEDLIDYSATKGAIHTFTKSLAQSLVAQGIRVNCVAPGPVWTPLNVADKPADEAAMHGSEVPMGRPAQPEEIAPTYVYLASEADSSYVTGEVIALLGGHTVGG